MLFLINNARKILVKCARILTLPFYIIVIVGCGFHQNNKNANIHPEYFDAIYKTVDTTRAEDKDKAMVYLDSAFNAFPNPGVFDLYAKDSLKADIYSYNKEDDSTTLLYLDSMQALVENHIDEEEFAERYVRALYYKGFSFFSSRKYNEALQYYTIAKKVELTKVKNTCNLSDCVHGPSDLLMLGQNKYPEAARSFVADYDFEMLCHKNSYAEVMRVQRSLTYAGICYFKSGVLDSAEYYYKKSLWFITENENKYPDNYLSTQNALGALFADMAALYKQKGEFSSSEELLLKSLDATKEADVHFYRRLHINLARVYIEENKLNMADELLTAAKGFPDFISNDNLRLNWYQARAEYYQKQNNSKQAYENLAAYTMLNDSIKTRQEEFDKTNVQQEMQEVQQRYNVEALKKDKETKNAYTIISILAISIFVTVTLMIWDNLRKTKQYLQKLQNVNLQVSENNAELKKAYHALEQSHNANSKILRVVAHDLKNPISAINNLIYVLLKNASTEDQKISFRAIQGSCANSLSLINNLLYEKKDTINLQGAD